MSAQVLGGRETVKVAVVQAASVFMDKKACLEKACDKIIEAGKEGAELIVFPECLDSQPIPIGAWAGTRQPHRPSMMYMQTCKTIPSLSAAEDTDILGKRRPRGRRLCGDGLQ